MDSLSDRLMERIITAASHLEVGDPKQALRVLNDATTFTVETCKHPWHDSEGDPLKRLEDDDAFGDLVGQIRAERIENGLDPDTGISRAEAVRKHDFPALLAFHSKHALGSLQRPSCLVCGKVPEEWPPAIRHMELPDIIVCHRCRDAACGHETKPEPSVMGAAHWPPPMPTAKDAIEAHVRAIEILCDAHNLDPTEWLMPDIEALDGGEFAEKASAKSLCQCLDRCCVNQGGVLGQEYECRIKATGTFAQNGTVKP